MGRKHILRVKVAFPKNTGLSIPVSGEHFKNAWTAQNSWLGTKNQVSHSSASKSGKAARMRSWFCIVLNTGGKQASAQRALKSSGINAVQLRGAWMEGISLLKSPKDTHPPTPPY